MHHISQEWSKEKSTFLPTVSGWHATEDSGTPIPIRQKEFCRALLYTSRPSGQNRNIVKQKPLKFN